MKQKEIDARGLACPQPVLLAKKAVEETGGCTIYVDNAAARENVSRMARTLGCDVTVEETDGGTRIAIVRKGGEPPVPDACSFPAAGPTVLAISTAAMGKGNDELGRILMRSFFHTVNEAIARPDTRILFNEGGTLAVEGSPVLEDLRALASQGIDILACGTCLSYFELTDKLAVGRISNMYDIATALLEAGKVVEL